jgi:hypothetical protein
MTRMTSWSRALFLFVVVGGPCVALACTSAQSPISSVGFGTIDDVNPPVPTKIPPPNPSGGGFNNSPCPGYDPPGNGAGCNFGFAQNWDGTCEYGHDLDAECNDVFTCEGTWTRRGRAGCFNRCPTTFDQIAPGSICAANVTGGADLPIGCSYFEGTCACVPDGTTISVDAGSPDAGGTIPAGRWTCAPAPKNGCPAQRPQLGGDCVRTMVCDYGSCTLRRDITFACENRIWIQASSSCDP